MKIYAVASALLFVIGGCGDEGAATPTREMQGTYSAPLTLEEFPEDFPAHRSFEGEWKLVLDGDEFTIDMSGPASISGELEASEDELVFNEKAAPVGAWNCYEEGKRLSGEVPGSYSYSLKDGELTLEVKEDNCPVRAVVLSREWTEETG